MAVFPSLLAAPTQFTLSVNQDAFGFAPALVKLAVNDVTGAAFDLTNTASVQIDACANVPPPVGSKTQQSGITPSAAGMGTISIPLTPTQLGVLFSNVGSTSGSLGVYVNDGTSNVFIGKGTFNVAISP